MARVVVIGGGFGGLASAARLAKLGHAVTLVERAETVGGALGPVTEAGFTWDGGPAHTLLPAVIRDLFRKSGRPAERELELTPLDPIREHRWPDGSRLRLPGGSRAAQIAAFDALARPRSGAASAAPPGAAWAAYVDGQTADWELLRTGWFEVPREATAPDLARAVTQRLAGRGTLHQRLRRSFDDRRLRDVAAFPLLAAGQDPRAVPEWLGVVSYLEQKFGAWTVAGGMGALGEALARRLETRRVVVLTGTRATDVVVRDGRAVGVATADGVVDADVVVCAIDPRQLPALAPYVRRTAATALPVVCHLGLAAVDEPQPAEVVLHTDPLLVLRTGGQAPAGHHAWTLLVPAPPGGRAPDPVGLLALAGVDVRDRIVARVDRSPGELAAHWGGSPLGVRWQGRGTTGRRLGPRTPIPGVYAAGAHATAGPGLPFAGLTASLVAQVVGEA